MGLRDQINKSPAIGAVVVVVVVAAAVGFYLFTQSGDGPPPAPEADFFYDVGSGELFTKAPTEISPTTPPSGATLEDGSPGGVRAYVFSCGDCADTASRFIGYVSRRNPQDPPNPRPATYDHIGQLVVAEVPEGGGDLDWGLGAQMMSEIEASMRERCGGQMPTRCQPTSQDAAG